MGGKIPSALSGSIENINNAAYRIAAKYGKSILSEGSEEYLQEILQPVIRNLAFNEDNEFRMINFYCGTKGGDISMSENTTAKETKAPENEEFVWSDEAFREGWNSVYNTEEPKPTNFLGRNRRALQMPGVYEKLQKYENSEERLFLEGFYEVDGAISDWEREERLAKVDEALLKMVQ